MKQRPKARKAKRLTLESLRDGKHHILTKDDAVGLLTREEILDVNGRRILGEHDEKWFRLHEAFKLNNIKAYILGYDFEPNTPAHKDMLQKIESEKPAEIRYIFVEDKLSDLAKLYKAFQEIEEITDVGYEEIMEKISESKSDHNSRAICFLDDLVNNIGLEGYVMNFLPGESRKVKNFRQDNPFTYNEESGLFSIGEKEIHKYLDPDDVELLIDQGYLEEDDRDEELIQLVIEAFNAPPHPLYPDDYWEEESQVIRGLPEDLKKRIRDAQDCINTGITGPMLVRRIILEYLKVI